MKVEAVDGETDTETENEVDKSHLKKAIDEQVKVMQEWAETKVTFHGL